MLEYTLSWDTVILIVDNPAIRVEGFNTLQILYSSVADNSGVRLLR